jgi:hypothetical protein
MRLYSEERKRGRAFGSHKRGDRTADNHRGTEATEKNSKQFLTLTPFPSPQDGE